MLAVLPVTIVGVVFILAEQSQHNGSRGFRPPRRLTKHSIDTPS